MEKFRGVDYYEVEELFTEQERLMRDTARAFVDDQVLPIIRAHHRAGTFPTDLISKMGAMGFFGANLKGYGCVGVSNVACGLIMQELEWGDSAIRSCASVQGALVMYPIQTFGSEAQRDRWLPALARGEAIGCFGLTEPDHGSDPGGMTTRAIRVRDGFLLNGAKRWITNGTLADVAVIWAKLDGQVHGFLVEKGTPGFQTSEMEGKFSFRASVTSELTFDDCLIPEANLLAEAEGLKAPLMCLNQARYGIVDEYPVMRHLLNLETVKTYEGTHDIHTLILGRDITGISAIE